MDLKYPEIIAELSGNHNGSLAHALDMIRVVKESGADAIKFQTYTADTMTIKVNRPEFFISDEDSLWRGKYLYDLYEIASTPWDWHAQLFEYSRSLGIEPFSTPFDLTAVDFLEKLEVQRYKVASFEITYLELIAKIAQTGKPMIISTGMATLQEIHEAVQTARENGCRDLTLLKCTSAYPSDPRFANLSTIPDLQKKFKCKIGLSDHTLGISVSLGAVALGATMIEKHITMRHDDGGVDSKFSLNPSQLRELVLQSRVVSESLGDVMYGVSELEKSSLRFRRSLFIVKNVKKGETVTRENVRVIRPGIGLPPKTLELVLGKAFREDLGIGTPLQLNHIVDL
jgi:pseudaminic acid synthase